MNPFQLPRPLHTSTERARPPACSEPSPSLPLTLFFVEKIWLELCGREADGGFDVRWRRLNLHLCWHFRMSPCKRRAPDNRSRRAGGWRAALSGRDLPGGMLAPCAGSWQKLAVCCGPCWWRLIIIQRLCDWAINLISTPHTSALPSRGFRKASASALLRWPREHRAPLCRGN